MTFGLTCSKMSTVEGRNTRQNGLNTKPKDKTKCTFTSEYLSGLWLVRLKGIKTMNKNQFNSFAKAVNDKKALEEYIKANQDEAYSFMVENATVKDNKTFYYVDGKTPLSLTEYSATDSVDWKAVAILLAGSLEKATEIANKNNCKTQRSGYFRFENKQPKQK